MESHLLNSINIMETFQVKFVAPNPVRIRENDARYRIEDLILDANVSGFFDVDRYDASVYADAEAVATMIRSKCQEMMQRCFDNWPRRASVLLSDMFRVEETLNEEFWKIGINVRAKIDSFTLTPQSQKFYEEMVEAGKIPSDRLRLDFEQEPEECYYVALPPHCCCVRRYYEPGEDVVVFYYNADSDERPTFQVKNVDFYREEDLKDGVVCISFAMPKRDVDISCVFPNRPPMANPFGLGFGIGMMQQMMMANGYAQNPMFTPPPPPPPPPPQNTVREGEWTCTCGCVNSGKFCSNCGSPRV